MKPYYQDDYATIYHGDCREVMDGMDCVDVAIADPPYEETSCEWDKWPHSWPTTAAKITRALWCFGSLRMFMAKREEFDDWKLSQEIIWEKHNGSSLHNDRFRKVHELAGLFYRGDWKSVYHQPIRDLSTDGRRETLRRSSKPRHFNGIGGQTGYLDGTRLMRSVIAVNSTHGEAVHETQKPLAIIFPLLEYSCPPGGTVVDPMVGSGSVLVAAKLLLRKSIGIETREENCELPARRLSQEVLALA